MLALLALFTTNIPLTNFHGNSSRMTDEYLEVALYELQTKWRSLEVELGSIFQHYNGNRFTEWHINLLCISFSFNYKATHHFVYFHMFHIQFFFWFVIQFLDHSLNWEFNVFSRNVYVSPVTCQTCIFGCKIRIYMLMSLICLIFTCVIGHLHIISFDFML